MLNICNSLRSFQDPHKTLNNQFKFQQFDIDISAEPARL